MYHQCHKERPVALFLLSQQHRFSLPVDVNVWQLPQKPAGRSLRNTLRLRISRSSNTNAASECSSDEEIGREERGGVLRSFELEL